MYLARRNQYLCAALTDGDHEPEADPYAFEEGDVKFTFSHRKDKTGGEREPGKKHKVSHRREWRVLATPYLMMIKSFLNFARRYLLMKVQIQCASLDGYLLMH